AQERYVVRCPDSSMQCCAMSRSMTSAVSSIAANDPTSRTTHAKQSGSGPPSSLPPRPRAASRPVSHQSLAFPPGRAAACARGTRRGASRLHLECRLTAEDARGQQRPLSQTRRPVHPSSPLGSLGCHEPLLLHTSERRDSHAARPCPSPQIP